MSRWRTHTVEEGVSRFFIGRDYACARPDLGYEVFRTRYTSTLSAEKKIHERCAAATPVVAHDEDLRLRMLYCFAVEVEVAPIEPAGARLQVIVETQPGMRKLPDSRVRAPA